MLKHVITYRESQNHFTIQKSCAKPSSNSVGSENEELIKAHEESVKNLVQQLIKENKGLKNKIDSSNKKVQSLQQKNNKLMKEVLSLNTKINHIKSFYENVDIYPIAKKKFQEIGEQLQKEIESQ